MAQGLKTASIVNLKTKRPQALVKDEFFEVFCSEISSGKSESFSLQTITKHTVQMSSVGLKEVRR